jgi:phosphate/sulfate permease
MTISPRNKYFLSIVGLVVAVAWMLHMLDEMIGAGMRGEITSEVLVWIIVSIVLALTSSIVFSYFRAHRNDYGHDREQELLDRESALQKTAKKK